MLSSELAKIAPKEIVVSEQTRLLLKSVLKDYYTTLRANTYFDINEASIFVKRYISKSVPYSNAELASSGAVMQYVLETQRGKMPKIEVVSVSETKKHLFVDNVTRRSLEIVKNFAGEKQGTLLQSLDFTVSAIGARQLFSMLCTLKWI